MNVDSPLACELELYKRTKERNFGVHPSEPLGFAQTDFAELRRCRNVSCRRYYVPMVQRWTPLPVLTSVAGAGSLITALVNVLASCPFGKRA